MRKIVYKSTFIKIMLFIVAAMLILSVWPMKLYRNEIIQSNPALTDGKSEVINYRNTASQVFIANHEHLENIKVLICEGTYTDEFSCVVSDSNGKVLATERFAKTPDSLPAYVDIIMDIDLEPGSLYTIKFNSIQSLYIGQEPWYNPETVAVSYYNADAKDGMNLVMDYEYSEPWSLSQNLLFIGIVVIISLVLIAILDVVFKDRGNEKMFTLEHGMKWVLNILTVLLIVFCTWCIATGVVSSCTPDNIFASVALVLFAGVAFYGINHNRMGQEAIVTGEYIRSHISDIIQSIAIAGVIQSCCEYVSGLYDIHHRVAERKEMLWFALVIIATFSAKEIYTAYNLIYIVAASIAGVVYYNLNKTPEMTSDDRFVLGATAAIAVLLGLIIIRVVLCLIKKKPFEKLNLPFAIVTGVYLLLTVIFRNTRWWTVVLAISVLLLAISYGWWNNRDRFFVNLTRGVVLQFILCTIWVWLHRPYSSYGTVRFTHFFHTETITATYLTMVGCVVTVLLLSKVRKSVLVYDENGKADIGKKLELRDIWKELCLFGVVMTYLVFTMARTAYFAIAVAVIFALIIMLLGNGKNSLKLLMRVLGLLAASVIIMIPITFEVQRTIPCIASDPYVYDIDGFQDEVLRGHQLNRLEYMTVGKLADIFFEKILGIENAGFSKYHDRNFVFNIYQDSMLRIAEETGYTWSDYEVTDEMWDKKPTDEYYGYLFDYISMSSGESDSNEGVYEENADASETVYSEEGSETVVEQVNLQSNNVDDENIEDADSSKVQDYTNGRLDIYKSYIEQLNMTGHETMGALLKDGSIATHAHDVYLQVAYDHGIPTGIAFVLFGIISFVTAIVSFIRSRKNCPLSAVTAVVLLAFAVAGLVEWTYHLGHPMTIVLWFSVIPMIFKNVNEEK